VGTLIQAFPGERWHKLIQSYRSDVAFRQAISTSLERAVQKFAFDYEDVELVQAVTKNTHGSHDSSQTAIAEILLPLVRVTGAILKQSS
jgi:hypothetical protein